MAEEFECVVRLADHVNGVAAATSFLLQHCGRELHRPNPSANLSAQLSMLIAIAERFQNENNLAKENNLNFNSPASSLSWWTEYRAMLRSGEEDLSAICKNIVEKRDGVYAHAVNTALRERTASRSDLVDACKIIMGIVRTELDRERESALDIYKQYVHELVHGRPAAEVSPENLPEAISNAFDKFSAEVKQLVRSLTDKQ